ncbi:UvrD-helicase domain-containing protein [Aeromonas caviae]|uniref:UvrD-helicase domain-containing protein n=1 Tax=Aeromonas caviae TaxID=648 RepID=UPI001EF10C89|nr:UvrD-helicase domain-containing protein [Aeromonas caviae]ULH04001.1 UvrD-helicase domain-containing protein [Aeromonas caviae]
MKINTLCLDEEAVSILSYSNIDSAWFNGFIIPDNNLIRRATVEDSIYLLSRKATLNSKLLVINVQDDKFFSVLNDKEKEICFDRIIHIALSKMGNYVIPKTAWGKYVSGNKIAVYASKKTDLRVYFDTNPSETNHIFAFDINNESIPLESVAYDETPFINAVINYDEALTNTLNLPTSIQEDKVANHGIELTSDFRNTRYEYHSLEQWYEKTLTDEQLDFVNKPYDEPVRLKGAAGTGKTLALTVKYLRDIFRFEDQKENKNFLFLTHSHATSQTVMDLIQSMDTNYRYGNLKYINCEVASLYDFAQDILNYNFKKINPISTDGLEGRLMQKELISSAIQAKLNDLRFKASILLHCSEIFIEYITNLDKREEFILDIANEISCVLDAENIHIGSQNAEKYTKGSREPWQMNLSNEFECNAVLEIHDYYKKQISELNMLSMDQMIADLNRYLSSHEWTFLKKEKGYDAIFIDELHCFTRPERMVFHELCRAEKPHLFMAYDLKQSTNESLINSMKGDTTGSALFRPTGVGKTQLVELTKVFRYSKEIADFLCDLDNAFPALDLASEWSKLQLDTNQKNGELPQLRVYDDNLSMIDSIFSDAYKISQDVNKRVAVLCINEALFASYSQAGRIKRFHEPITSRDEIIKLNKVKRKCIFSRPEYVAGLQFDVVFVINVDRNELDEIEVNCGQYRRFISQLYLASSRAKTKLIITATSERRGPAKIILSCIKNGTVISESKLE